MGVVCIFGGRGTEFLRFWALNKVVFRCPDTLLPRRCQESLRCDEVDEGEAGVEPVEVLCQASIAHLHESEALLEWSEDVLDA